MVLKISWNKCNFELQFVPNWLRQEEDFIDPNLNSKKPEIKLKSSIYCLAMTPLQITRIDLESTTTGN